MFVNLLIINHTLSAANIHVLITFTEEPFLFICDLFMMLHTYIQGNYRMFQLTAIAKGLLSYFTIHVAYDLLYQNYKKKQEN